MRFGRCRASGLLLQSEDFLSTEGFDVLHTRMKDGKSFTDEMVSFMKQRYVAPAPLHLPAFPRAASLPSAWAGPCPLCTHTYTYTHTHRSAQIEETYGKSLQKLAKAINVQIEKRYTLCTAFLGPACTY